MQKQKTAHPERRDKLQVLERELSILSARVQTVEKHLKYGSPLTSEPSDKECYDIN